MKLTFQIIAEDKEGYTLESTNLQDLPEELRNKILKSKRAYIDFDKLSISFK